MSTDSGAIQVKLGVHAENAGAISLYRRFGFVVWGTENGSLVVGGEPHDEHHMACRAPSAASLENQTPSD